jgi:hypothetical protein
VRLAAEKLFLTAVKAVFTGDIAIRAGWFYQ